MKLEAKLRFSEFHCPALKLELGAGLVAYADKTTVTVVEAEKPSRFYVVQREIPFYLVLELQPVPDKFWAAGGGSMIRLPNL